VRAFESVTRCTTSPGAAMGTTRAWAVWSCPGTPRRRPTRTSPTAAWSPSPARLEAELTRHGAAAGNGSGRSTPDTGNRQAEPLVSGLRVSGARLRRGVRALVAAGSITPTVAVVAACAQAGAAPAPPAHTPAARAAHTPGVRPAYHADLMAKPGSPLPAPAPLAPFGGSASVQGVWRPAGRRVGGVSAVYVTSLIPPGGTRPAGIAWLDTGLLSARLYSGSVSPGGGPFRYTAPIRSAQAATLVAAFNGGFKMNAARGGYYTEGRVIVPLRRGAASLVIYCGGSIGIGAWGTDVSMTRDVISVRQNLVPLVVAGHPAARAYAADWYHTWGETCGATSCAASVPGVEHQWRSGAGVTADGALVYVTGPALDPLQIARLLVRAGAVRGMELDINPYWDVFVSYDPPSPNGLAAPANGRKLLPQTVQGPATFFGAWWARDFITVSARRS